MSDNYIKTEGFVDTIGVSFQNTKTNFFLYFLNISENNFYGVIKGGSNGKRHYILPVCNMTYLNLC